MTQPYTEDMYVIECSCLSEFSKLVSRHSTVVWSDFEFFLTLSRLCQIVGGPQFQNFTLDVALTCRITFENLYENILEPATRGGRCIL